MYIVAGLILIVILTKIGLIPEFLVLVVESILIGLISGFVAWIFDWGFETGYKVGLYIGVLLYAIYCIARIIAPTITIEFYSDGKSKVLSERGSGIVGLITLIGAILLSIFCK